MRTNRALICLMIIGLTMLPVRALAQDLPSVEETQAIAE